MKLHTAKLEEFEKEKIKMAEEHKQNEDRVRVLEEAKNQALCKASNLSTKEKEQEELLKAQ